MSKWIEEQEKELYKVFYVWAQVSSDMTEEACNSWSSYSSPPTPGITGVCHHCKILLEEHAGYVHYMCVSVDTHTETKEKPQLLAHNAHLVWHGASVVGAEHTKLSSRDAPSLASLSP